MPTLSDLRAEYHANLIQNLWGQRAKPNVSPATPWYVNVEGINRPVFNTADGHNDVSVVLSDGVATRVGVPVSMRSGQGSTSGKAFERATSAFIKDALDLFSHLTARQFIVTPPAKHFLTTTATGRNRRLPKRIIGSYAQFEHLVEIERLVKGNKDLQAALGGDYQVDPDIFVLFEAFTDADLNLNGAGLGAGDLAARSFARQANNQNPKPILHASISCKWTMRRDRAQNIRLEALNMVRNRKGRLPHVTAVTMECDPGILGSLSLGTGDIDCVYHGALNELMATANDAATKYGGAWVGTRDHLQRMVGGSRLRDIADLPVDLLI
jgi:hypothetical protein